MAKVKGCFILHLFSREVPLVMKVRRTALSKAVQPQHSGAAAAVAAARAWRPTASWARGVAGEETYKLG